jgi:hypothetical protein
MVRPQVVYRGNVLLGYASNRDFRLWIYCLWSGSLLFNNRRFWRGLRPHKAVNCLAMQNMVGDVLGDNVAFAEEGASVGVVAFPVQFNYVFAHRLGTLVRFKRKLYTS